MLLMVNLDDTDGDLSDNSREEDKLLSTKADMSSSEEEVTHYLVLAIVVTVVSVSETFFRLKQIQKLECIISNKSVKFDRISKL